MSETQPAYKTRDEFPKRLKGGAILRSWADVLDDAVRIGEGPAEGDRYVPLSDKLAGQLSRDLRLMADIIDDSNPQSD